MLGKALVLLREPLWRRGLVHGVAATIEHQSALAGLAPSLVVDIGANQGQFALFCLAAFPWARVEAFEPLPAAAARFRRLFAGKSNIHLHECAVGPRRGRV